MKSLERSLGLPSVVAISMGAMLGSGIFVLPGLAFGLTGPSVWLAYVGAGLLVLPAAFAKSELATAMPVSGGSYVYLDRAFGPLAGTVAGLGLWLSLLLKAAFALVGFGEYLYVLAEIPLRPVALVLLGVVVALNIVGVRKVGKAQIAVVAVAVVGLTILAAWGLGVAETEHFEPMLPHGSFGFLAAMGTVYIAFSGVTKVAAIAEEVKNPGRNLPLGILLSLVVVCALYGVVTAALVGNLDPGTFAEDSHPVYSMASRLGGPWIGYGLAGLAILTMTSMANAGLLAASRFPFAMSREDLLPPFLRHVHAVFVTPVASIALTGILMAAAIALLDIERIAKLASSLMITAFVAVNLTVMVLRESNLQWYKPSYKSPFYPWMQLVGVLTGLALLVALGPMGLVALVAMTVPGLLLWFLYGRHRTNRLGVLGSIGPRQELLSSSTMPSKEVSAFLPGEAAVVVPLLGRERSPERLVEVAASLADGKKIEVIHLTDIPEQTMLDAMLEEDVAVSSVRRRMQAMAEEQKLDLEFQPVVTRDVARTVNDLSVRLHNDWLVMGWRRKRGLGVLRLSPVTWLLNHLPCKVALFKDAGIRTIREILVLAEPGPHDSLVVSTADHLAELFGARLTFARHLSKDAAGMTVQAEIDYLDQLRRLCTNEPVNRLVRGNHRAKDIAAVTGGYDLLVMGAGRTASIWEMLRGTVEDDLTQRAACSVLRLQTPRQRTHEALDRNKARGEGGQLRLGDFIDPSCVAARVAPKNKDALFAIFAEQFAEALPDVSAQQIIDALWERERAQNTAVGLGVAMPHATISSADRAYLGVFTSAKPLDFQAPDGEPVDVFFVTLGPPSERMTHLLILSGLAQRLSGTPLLDRLRAARSSAELLDAIDRCEPA